MRRVILAAVPAAALLAGAPARADVVHRASAAGAGAGSTVTVPMTVPAGANRLLAVAVSTAATGVSGVTYGQHALTQRFLQNGAVSRTYIFTLVAPDAGSADVTVTGDAGTKVVGASLLTGVDQASPVIQARGHTRSDTGMIDSVELGGTVPGDGLFGAITVGNASNLFGFITLPLYDDAPTTSRWNIRSGAVLAAGATRGGNRGTIPDAGIRWDYTIADFSKPSERATAGISIRRAAPAVLPAVTTGIATAITRASAALAGDVTSDGEGYLTQRGIALCASPCTPEVGAPGTTVSPSGGLTTGAFTVTAPGLSYKTTYTYRAFASNAAGVGYGATGGFTTLADQPPTARAGGSYLTAEGQPVTLDAGGSSDPEGDALTYSWDVNGDGAYGDATGVSPTLTWAQLAALGIDGPTQRQVTVRVSDATTAVISEATPLTVIDLAPTGTPSHPSQVEEGTQVTISMTGATDPSPADVAAGLHFAFDTDGDSSWDVGDGTYAGSGTESSATFTAPDGPRTFTPAILIIDRDGGTAAYRFSITVANAADRLGHGGHGGEHRDAAAGRDRPVEHGRRRRVHVRGRLGRRRRADRRRRGRDAHLRGAGLIHDLDRRDRQGRRAQRAAHPRRRDRGAAGPAADRGGSRGRDRARLGPQRPPPLRARVPPGHRPLPAQPRGRRAGRHPAPRRQQLAQLPAGARGEEPHAQTGAGQLHPGEQQAGLDARRRQLARRRRLPRPRLRAAARAHHEGPQAAPGDLPGDADDARRQRPRGRFGQGQVLGTAAVTLQPGDPSGGRDAQGYGAVSVGRGTRHARVSRRSRAGSSPT